MTAGNNKGSEQGTGLIDASTVILVREKETGGFEIFLMRRHRNQSFMGGAYVFPGGRVDDADRDLGMLDYMRGDVLDEMKKQLEPELSDEQVMGFYCAALRETFEEAGVLLCSDSSGELVKLNRYSDERIFELRKQLHGGIINMRDVGDQLQSFFRPGALIPYSHWITPEIESARFNTYFFLAVMPDAQVPVHDNMELTESLWISPHDALRMHRSKEILLMPPTLKTVEDLEAYSSIRELIEAAEHASIYPILPQVFSVGIQIGVLLPNDPDYALSDYKRQPEPGKISRIVLEDGIWKTLIMVSVQN